MTRTALEGFAKTLLASDEGAAPTIGTKVPPTLLACVDEVIEWAAFSRAYFAPAVRRVTGLLLGEPAAEANWLELNRDNALIVVGWLLGYYLDEHENMITAVNRVFGK